MRWHEIAEPLRSGGAPDASEEYFVYQTLVGAHPIEPGRLAAYLEKALREAKRTTNWIEPDEAWEQRVKDFTLALLEHEPFRADFDPFAERVAREGRRSALAQTLLKLTSPGLPDVYQGDELEALSLVDPDNRRPVDWAARRSALAAIANGAAPTPETMKLAIIFRALELRSRRPEAFDERGSYEPLDAGPGVCAFKRGTDIAVVVGVRDWNDDVVPGLEGAWRDVLSGGEVELGARARAGDLVDEYGLALLERTR
jgi:(1->4)-alpha-D-glucan 1-alpha-D-glucosylmutase